MGVEASAGLDFRPYKHIYPGHLPNEVLLVHCDE